jgi:hypothetical protein
MIRSERPASRSAIHIANRVVRDLEEGHQPVALDGLTNVWQTGARVGRSFYTATFVQSAQRHLHDQPQTMSLSRLAMFTTSDMTLFAASIGTRRASASVNNPPITAKRY